MTFRGPGQNIRAYVTAAMQGPAGFTVAGIDTAFISYASLLETNS